MANGHRSEFDILVFSLFCSWVFPLHRGFRSMLDWSRPKPRLRSTNVLSSRCVSLLGRAAPHGPPPRFYRTKSVLVPLHFDGGC